MAALRWLQLSLMGYCVSTTYAASLVARQSSARSWAYVHSLDETCEDLTCGSSPYKLIPQPPTAAGDLLTTCLMVVALGCYQSKAHCCAALASSFEVLQLAIGGRRRHSNQGFTLMRMQHSHEKQRLPHMLVMCRPRVPVLHCSGVSQRAPFTIPSYGS